ncbi:hypothetical protein KGQ24_03565, partial [Patescibacteria group bacterium]|nr:hypothetical protein [Patescibacteria group bacterium]
MNNVDNTTSEDSEGQHGNEDDQTGGLFNPNLGAQENGEGRTDGTASENEPPHGQHDELPKYDLQEPGKIVSDQKTETLNYISENFERNDELSGKAKAERIGINKFGETDIIGSDGKGVLESFRD